MPGTELDEWPDVVYDEAESHEEYDRLVEAVGELTSAVLDCQVKGLLVPSATKSLKGFLLAVLTGLEEEPINDGNI